MKPRAGSPVVGYNTGVRYRDRTYHIQTEDSGRDHPHVITHLFADGGRVIATRRTGYEAYVGTERMTAMVKEIVLTQHKAMFVSLRDGAYDAILDSDHGSPRHEPALALDVLERSLDQARRSAPAAPSARAAPTPSHEPAPLAIAASSTRNSSARIPDADPGERTLDELIVAELATLLAEVE